MMQGTPYVYSRSRIRLFITKCTCFPSVEDFRDLDSINAYHELVEEQKVLTPEEMMGYLRYKSRDNARTPFQWDDSENAGFTTGTPWIMVNPNYKAINAKAELSDPQFYFLLLPEIDSASERKRNHCIWFL